MEDGYTWLAGHVSDTTLVAFIVLQENHVGVGAQYVSVAGISGCEMTIGASRSLMAGRVFMASGNSDVRLARGSHK